MSAGQFLSRPAAATGLSIVSSATAWAYGTPVALATLTTDIAVIGFEFHNTDIPVVDTNQDILFDITVGETTKIQLPFNMKADSLVGYDPTGSGAIQAFYLPEPYFIPKGSVVAIKVCDSIAAALTYNGVKLLYNELAVLPAVVLNSPDDASSDSDTTPTLNFTGTDSDAAMALEYQVQVDTVNTFDSTDSGNTAPATIVLVQQSSSIVTGAGAVTNTLPIDSTQHNLLVAFVRFNSGTVGAPAGWVSAGVNTDGNQLWYYEDNPGGLSSFNFTGTNSLFITEWSGVALSSSLDTTSPYTHANTTTITATTTGNIANTGELAVALGSDFISPAGTTGLSIDVGWTEMTNNKGTSLIVHSAPAYKLNPISGATLSITDTSTVSNMNIVIAVFKPGTIPIYAPLLSELSTSDAGFTSGHPFASATPIDYTVQSVLPASDTYYWRVRAVRNGSTDYGDWSSVRSFDVTTGGAVANTGFFGFM